MPYARHPVSTRRSCTCSPPPRLVDTVEETRMNRGSIAARTAEARPRDLRGKKRLEELPEKQAILEVRHKLRDVAALRHKAELLVGKLKADLKAHQDEIAIARPRSSMPSRPRSCRRPTTARSRRSPARWTGCGGAATSSRWSRSASWTASTRRRQQVDEDRRGDRPAHREGGCRDRAVQGRWVGRCRPRSPAARPSAAPSRGRSLPQLLAQYEAARESKGGVGVGRLDGDSCSACRMSLPAERISELAAGPDVGVCPHCHRLIVVRAGDE